MEQSAGFPLENTTRRSTLSTIDAYKSSWGFQTRNSGLTALQWQRSGEDGVSKSLQQKRSGSAGWNGWVILHACQMTGHQKQLCLVGLPNRVLVVVQGKGEEMSPEEI